MNYLLPYYCLFFAMKWYSSIYKSIHSHYNQPSQPSQLKQLSQKRNSRGDIHNSLKEPLLADDESNLSIEIRSNEQLSDYSTSSLLIEQIGRTVCEYEEI